MGFNTFINEEVTVHLSQFNSDDKNAGFYVSKIESKNENLVKEFNKIAIPHITTSVAEFGKPVNTKNLFVKKCKIELVVDFIIKGKFGHFQSK